jgi:YidC/Oxa1 family membrane protein insertase
VNRLFLYSGLLFILILIFDAYDRDYNQSDLINIEQNENTTSPSSKQPPQVNAPTKDLPTDIITAPREIAIIENSKLLVKYDSNSGELLYAELKDYSVDLGSKDNIIILDFANKKYSASSDIQVINLNNTTS